MKNNIVIFFMLSLLPFLTFAGGGFSLAKTRVVVSSESESGVKVSNTSSVPVLIQSWVSFYNSKDVSTYGEKAPFIVTPPLYRQGTGEGYVKIIPTGGSRYPSDRESVFYLNVKAIPVSYKNGSVGESKVSFSFTNEIKLFYRPQGLVGSSVEAYKHLVFSRSEGGVNVKNPTPYYITFSKLSVGGVGLKGLQNMVPPLGVQLFELPPGKSNEITYQTIDEFGGVTPLLKASF